MASIARRPLIAGALALPAAGAAAQPAAPRPLTILVGFPAGGVADIIARIVAERARTLLNQPVVIENRGGASGTLAAAAVARAQPDGQTLLFVTSGHAGNGALYQRLPYDGVRDFAPVASIAETPVLVVVSAASRHTTLASLVGEIRSRPGALNYAAGAGGATLPALAAAVFARELGLQMEQVGYRGTAPALAALIAGDLDFAFDTVAGAIGLVRSGQLRALAVTSAARLAVLPEVPTVAETLLPGFEVTGWFGILAPAGTPEPVIARLDAVFRDAVTTPEVQSRLRDLGAEPLPGSAAEFGARLVRETVRWTEVITRLGLRAD